MLRLENARNEWIHVRSVIEKTQKEIQEVEDEETRSDKLEILKLQGQKLWCSMYKQKIALVAMELQASEQNFEIANCWLCARLSEGYTMKDTCEYFPEKAVEPGKSSGSSSSFKAVESKFFQKKNHPNKHRHENHKNEKDVKNSHSKMRFRTRSEKIVADTSVGSGMIDTLDNYGFGPQEKITCLGSIVFPKEANKDVYERMQEAILGPQMLKSTCQQSQAAIVNLIETKRDILAQVVGTSLIDNDTCDLKEKDEEKKADCVSKMFRQFSRLRNQVFTSEGYIRDEWRQARGALSRYGSGGSSVCQDINYCASEDAEDYVWRWSRSNRKSESEMSMQKKKLPDNVKRRPPAYHDAEKFQKIAEAFEFPDAANPLWSQLKVQPFAKNGVTHG